MEKKSEVSWMNKELGFFASDTQWTCWSLVMISAVTTCTQSCVPLGKPAVFWLSRPLQHQLCLLDWQGWFRHGFQSFPITCVPRLFYTVCIEWRTPVVRTATLTGRRLWVWFPGLNVTSWWGVCMFLLCQWGICSVIVCVGSYMLLVRLDGCCSPAINCRLVQGLILSLPQDH